MKQVYIFYNADGKQIAYALPSGVEISDHLSQIFQSGSSQKSASPVYLQDVELAGDYVFVLMQPLAHVPNDDDTAAAMTTEVYLVPVGTGQAISIDRIRAAVLETFGPEAMDVDSLRAHGNAAGDCDGKGEKLILEH